LVFTVHDVGKETGTSFWDETFLGWSTVLEGLDELASSDLRLATAELPTFHFLFPESRSSADNRNDGSVVKHTYWVATVWTVSVVANLD
jgi:hypothetical protein